MMWSIRALIYAVLVVLAGCGPSSSRGDDDGGSSGGDGGGGGSDAGATGVVLRGTVWGPGHHFPVMGALVAGFPSEPEAIPDGAYCQACLTIPENQPYAISQADGSFELRVQPGAAYELVVQKGQFRRVRSYLAPVTEGEYELPDELTTLPNRTVADAGDTIPKIALVYGDYDAIQDVLAKVGIGDEDGAHGLAWGSEQGIFDVYDNHGSGGEPHGQSLSDLLRDPARLAQYHLIFFACSYNANFDFMADATVQQNLRDYVRAGGKLYVSDYAYAVAELTFPEFVWFTDPLHGGCVENRFPAGCNHGPPFDAPSRSRDEDLSAWLFAVDGSVTGSMPTAEFETRENFDTIGDLSESYVGDDEDGNPVYEAPKVWVEGTWNYAPEDVPSDWDFATYHPLTVSWPYGCGRVLYTTYHTVGGTDGNRHPGFLTQELILWHLILELQACQDVTVL